VCVAPVARARPAPTKNDAPRKLKFRVAGDITKAKRYNIIPPDAP
jgi:hypothetical protein